MIVAAPAPLRSPRPSALVALALAALALGLMVYWTDRDVARSVLVPAWPALAGQHLFGAAGDWLPSFVHVFGFSLLTAAIGREDGAPAYGACGAWIAIDAAFEIGQHPALSPLLADALRAFGDRLAAPVLADYFERGHFDVADLLAACAGGLAAAATVGGFRVRVARPSC